MIELLTVITTKSTNPYYNLALEEYLLHHIKDNECMLYLWQNSNTVVIGRNQNAYKELNLQKLEKRGGNFVRRLSGGGAVYHDLGNLNFTFLAQKENYNLEKQLQVIVHALHSLGIKAEKSGRNDITVQGKKISGNAFYKTGHHYYHHGTLLVNVDLMALSDVLNVSTEKMKSHGVESVRSRVMNLSEVDRTLTIERLTGALINSFGEVYQCIPEVIEFDKKSFPDIQEEIRCLEEKYISWDWRFGCSIEFQIEYINRFSWGELLIQFQINHGRINDLMLYSDALNTELFPLIREQLLGIRFDAKDICEHIAWIKGNDSAEIEMLSDIQAWLKEKIYEFV